MLGWIDTIMKSFFLLFLAFIFSTNALRCWMGSTFDKSTEYPPKITDCATIDPVYDTCQTYDSGPTGKALRCVTASFCQINMAGSSSVKCCQTDLCNDPNGNGGTLTPVASKTPISHHTPPPSSGTILETAHQLLGLGLIILFISLCF